MFDEGAYQTIVEFKEIAYQCSKANNKMFFAGNGASASLAEHGAVDFTKQGGVRSMTFHDPNLITCFSNDYGYDYWIAKALEFHYKPGDVVVLISCSGESPSVINAAKFAKDNSLKVITFTGRDKDNALKKIGDVNFWVNTDAYNIVECIHGAWLTATIDLLIGKAEYETRFLIENE